MPGIMQTLIPAQAMEAARQCESKQQLIDAEYLYRRIIETDPLYHPAYHGLGLLACRVNKMDIAAELLASAIALDGMNVNYHRDRGEICRRLGQLEEAAKEARVAVSIDPGQADSHYNLGLALNDQESPQEAARSYREAVRLDPTHGHAWNNLGSVLEKMGDDQEAIAAYRKAIALNSDHAEALGNLGGLLSKEGAIDEARSLLSRSLELKPTAVSTLYRISSLKHFAANDPQLKTLEALAENPAGLPEKERIQLQFALGKAREDAGHYDEAFSAFAKGNELRRAQLPAHNNKGGRDADAIIKYFSQSQLDSHAGSGIKDSTPVFIVGMPRSGTSLVEQILSSHSAVYGAGELKDFHAIVCDLLKVTPETSFVEGMADLPDTAFVEMGRRYLEKLRDRSRDASRITDKMPANFYYLGLIRLALPGAKIIHTARDPMDSCMSCYSRLFNDTMDFSYDLQSLGEYYVRYHRLMQHWQAVLPAESLLTVRYEELVTDIEGHTRAMLKHIGLPWEDDCLEYYNNQRPVRTASLAQVREPVYQTSVGGWQRYHKQLQPLLDTVGDYR